MKRFVMEKLIKWKNSEDRKPLILGWARQVGKTYILQEFGKNNYDDVAYFNFDHDEGLAQLFSNTKDPIRIIEQLSLYSVTMIICPTLSDFFDSLYKTAYDFLIGY